MMLLDSVNHGHDVAGHDVVDSVNHGHDVVDSVNHGHDDVDSVIHGHDVAGHF